MNGFTHGTYPVRHFVCDGFVAPDATWTVDPPGSAIYEAVYDNDCERGKRTTRALYGWARRVMDQMHELEVLRQCSTLCGAVAYPDPSAWGGGVQVLSPNGWLSTHLDGSVHPERRHLRRAVQMVCFCHSEWRREWGGNFYFTDPMGAIVAEYEPLPGRLIAFENTLEAYHGVSPVTGPRERVSVAASLLADANPNDSRMRAAFFPHRKK